MICPAPPRYSWLIISYGRLFPKEGRPPDAAHTDPFGLRGVRAVDPKFKAGSPGQDFFRWSRYFESLTKMKHFGH